MVDALFLDDGRKQDFGIGSNPVLTTNVIRLTAKNGINEEYYKDPLHEKAEQHETEHRQD